MSYALGCNCQHSLGANLFQTIRTALPATAPARPIVTGTPVQIAPRLFVSPVLPTRPPIAPPIVSLPALPPAVTVPPVTLPTAALPVPSSTALYNQAHTAAQTGDGDTAAQLASVAAQLDQAAAAQTGTPVPPPPVPVVPDQPSSDVLPLVALYGVVALALLYLGKRVY